MAKSGAQFSDEIRKLAKENTGYAGRQFIAQAVHWQDELPEEWQEFKAIFLKEVLPKDSDGQIVRVLERFAQVAFAGEKASEWGITGWKSGVARTNVIKVANAWIENRGSTTSREEQQAIELIRSYIEYNAPSQMNVINRFNGRVTIDGFPVRNRTGFIDKVQTLIDGEDEPRQLNHYYFLPNAWRQHVCKGMDARFVAKVLAKNGYIKKSSDGKYQRKMSLPDMPRQRVYHVLPHIISDKG